MLFRSPYGCACHIWFSSIEEFAELIIKECIEVINDNVEVALSATGNVVFEDKLLKEHFGIKDEPID